MLSVFLVSHSDIGSIKSKVRPSFYELQILSNNFAKDCASAFINTLFFLTLF